ncbi:MAG: molybdopterin-dependent oxidoreductase [Anaerolineales bacterium]|nr:molybdopterin-dependent oxidoreductase [Anaerolineales bacterium]
MKLFFYGLLVLSILLGACAPSASPAPESGGELLLVTDGTTEKSFSVADLEALPVTESTFNEVTHIGISLAALMDHAGFDAQVLQAVKAIAADGYSVNYDPALFLREDVIVAYATLDGPLPEDDGTFRMVLPGEEGKLNIRMLVELRLVP